MKSDLLVKLAYLILIVFSALAFFISIPVQINITVYSLAIIYIGSVKSVELMIRTKIAHREDGEGEEEEIETIGAKEAKQFPIMGSAVLLGLYLAIKIFGKGIVNVFLMTYFGFSGMESLRELISSYASKDLKAKLDTLDKNILFERKDWFGYEFKVQISLLDVYLGIVSGLICIAYVVYQHWLTNNIIGIFFCIFAIQNLFLGNFKIGTLLLIGLFFYDIFWVFGTDVMLTVAKNIDGPIKLLFPKQPIITSSKDLSLLGLGDIVIPGIFLSLCMRYDFLSKYTPKGKPEERTIESVKEEFEKTPKTYFISCMVGYCVGIIATVMVMIITNHGQPALLYLVPGCLGSVFITAYVKNEVSKIWTADESKTLEILSGKKKEGGEESEESDTKKEK